MFHDPLETLPPGHRAAAEEIRAHLVALRGGAPFLSSSDALTLTGWLDEGVSVPTIVLALERAAQARRKRRSRIPLGLRHAKRHLHKPMESALPAQESSDHPFSPVAESLRQGGEAANELADALLALEDDLVRSGLSLVRQFFLDTWTALSEDTRGQLLAEATEELSDMAELVDEATLRASAEELARDTLRQRYPYLTAATLWQLAEHR